MKLYNLKNKECQANFKSYTSETNMLSSTVTEEGDNDAVVKRFIKKREGCTAINFKKVKVKESKVKLDTTPYDKIRNLKDKDDCESKREIEKVQEDIAEAALQNFTKVKKELS